MRFYFGMRFHTVAPRGGFPARAQRPPPQGVEAAAQPLGTPPAVEDSTAYRLLELPDPTPGLVSAPADSSHHVTPCLNRAMPTDATVSRRG